LNPLSLNYRASKARIAKYRKEKCRRMSAFFMENPLQQGQIHKDGTHSGAWTAQA